MDKILECIENNKYFNEEVKSLLINFYKESQNSLSSQEKIALKKKVDDILEQMFRTVYSYSIPMEFINSPIGEYLLKIKLDMNNVIVYGISELMVLSKKSKAMIFNDFHNGKLIGIESGKKRLIVNEDAVFDYLTSVGRNPMTYEDAKFRIKIFNKLIREGYTLEAIKEKL